jgi:hypothetical protein
VELGVRQVLAEFLAEFLHVVVLLVIEPIDVDCGALDRRRGPSAVNAGNLGRAAFIVGICS